ncbi:hypothetical protein [Bacillus sp. MUM 13]|uniref:hypothetical protein n=1 Tax=Bacillus sp. MUM 13 TaxID=1678001 RepID=UPI0008F5E192|nr:hypothetical protein [Bacillus sp. MUM 13]OIK13468.1 hypothetical protein BIV59_05870 [Bacillus sp. MUM 13]
MLLFGRLPTWQPDLISSFLAPQKNIYFQQLVAGNEFMAHLLEKGEIDMCISSTPIEGSDIEWILLLTEEII